MKLYLIQNHVGQYNMIGNERSLIFKLAIKDDDGVLIKDGDIAAILEIHTEEDPEGRQGELQDLWENGCIDDIFNQAWQYAQDTWSSTDYEAHCLLFAGIYIQNRTELENAFKEDRSNILLKKIEVLQNQLDGVGVYPHVPDEIINILDLEVSKIEEKLARAEGLRDEYKKGTDSYERQAKYVDRIKEELAKLRTSLEGLVKAQS